MHHWQDLQKERIRYATCKKTGENESSHAALLLFVTISIRAINSMEQHSRRCGFERLNATFLFVAEIMRLDTSNTKMTRQEDRADEVSEVQEQLAKCSIKKQEEAEENENESEVEDSAVKAVTAGLNDLSVQPPESPADERLERAPVKNKDNSLNRNQPYTIAQNVSFYFYIAKIIVNINYKWGLRDIEIYTFKLENGVFS